MSGASSTAAGTTLGDYLQSIHPAWARDLQGWFHWPPDTFLLTSRLLEDTGVYRFAVVSNGPPNWPPRDWNRIVAEQAGQWHEWLSGSTRTTPAWIADCIGTIAKHLSTPVRELYDWGAHASARRKPAAKPVELSDLCAALMGLHATADAACRRFGLPSGYACSGRDDTEAANACCTNYLANMLLITTGTLSRLPRHQGIVLPKMRTPQVGMTLRSLSLHVTFHRTDVDVKWRSLPWVNRDENTINVLVVPFPYAVRPEAFHPHAHPGFAETLGAVRYFNYSPQPEAAPADARKPAFDPNDVLNYLRAAERHVRRVHLIVFPELSLTRDQLVDLQKAMAEAGRSQLPLIIAGITSDPGRDGRSVLGTNEVVLSTFFAGKWYDIKQAKHHRWRLECSQIEQYGLAGMLAGTQLWWEAIDLPKRQVCYLAPNGWLTLCPLICEDLARQEPVSDVIRGVGPTLLLAILLDGPQVKERWSARYASVLADDPGTSVLTVTSYGMASRARRPGETLQPDPVCSVALWNDQKSGYREVRLGPKDGAAVLTMSAEWVTEFTADGRDDGGWASQIVLHGFVALPKEEPAVTPRARRRAIHLKHGDPIDIAELSVLTHLIDAMLDQPRAVLDELCEWAAGAKKPGPFLSKLVFAASVTELIDESRFRTLRRHGDRGTRVVRKDMGYAIRCFQDVMADAIEAAGAGANRPRAARLSVRTKRWDVLIERARELLAARPRRVRRMPGLEQGERRRVCHMVARSILWGIHMRLEVERRNGMLTYEQSQLLHRIEGMLDE